MYTHNTSEGYAHRLNACLSQDTQSTQRSLGTSVWRFQLNVFGCSQQRQLFGQQPLHSALGTSGALGDKVQDH